MPVAIQKGNHYRGKIMEIHFSVTQERKNKNIHFSENPTLLPDSYPTQTGITMSLE